jgi:rubrerythrin
MMSQIPLQLDKLKKEDIDREILRAGIIAELDAVSLYEQMASLTKKESIRKILLDIAREEKTHVGEFQALLLKEDEEQAEELLKGDREVREKTGG